MNFFNKVLATAGLAWAWWDALKRVADMVPLAEEAKAPRDWGRLAMVLAKAAKAADGCAARAGRMRGLGWMDDAALERAQLGAQICAQGLKAVAAYSADVAQGRGLGEESRRFGLDAETRWAGCRGGMLEALADGDAPVAAKVGAAMGAMGLMGVSCGIRGEAAAMKGRGELDEEATEALAARVRAAATEMEGVARAAKSMSRRREGEPKGESAREKDAADARARANRQCEEAQIYWLGGMVDRARECLVVALAGPTQEAREAARGKLGEEVHWVRGNEPGFCEWARAEFALEAPGSAARGARPKA